MYDLALLSLFKASIETLYMVFISGFVSIVIGLMLGCLLFITANTQALANPWLHRSLGIIVNVTRSIPFIILMIALIPLTRFVAGTSIGTNAALVPLTVAAIPFYARICENALSEVPYGLIETGHAMGATNWQIITRILIPESLPALIRGGTLLLIGLIGYSAMAGVVGGGGLGELAINYGYQRFNVAVMLETVFLLVLLVQLVQMAGDFLAVRRSLKLLILASTILWAFCFAYQFWPQQALAEETLRVGVMSGKSEEVMKAAASVAGSQYGLQLQIVTFNDYVQPNTALDNGSIDVNIFQHQPYLDGQVNSRHYALVPIAKTFVYPMGFYSDKIHSAAELRRGAVIAIPNDPSNGGRALLLLDKAGLITLKPGSGAYAKLSDITQNPLDLKFRMLDAAQLPRVLKDVDLAAVTNDFIGPTGLTINQAVLKEDRDSPYANLIVVRQNDKSKPVYKKLIAVMHSQSVVRETQKIYPDGAAIPAWK